MKRALITGITGQDGSYLAEFLLQKGYEVHGIIRRTSTFNTQRIEHLYQDPHTKGARMFLHYGDMTDKGSLEKVIKSILPDEIYNLAAQSHVATSWALQEYTMDVNAIGTLRIINIARFINKKRKIKLYQASTSEMFGNASAPQSELTYFNPISPYALSKWWAYQDTVGYRDTDNMFICNGILFNHESPRRGKRFVTRKITRAAARIYYGLQDKLYLGNLDAWRDWGYAGDYVEAMWLMMQQDKPADYVIATGKTYSVRTFAKRVFDKLGMDYQEYVEIDPKYYRPKEVHKLCGDASKAYNRLKWQPEVNLNQLIDMMLENDLKEAEREKMYKELRYESTKRKSFSNWWQWFSWKKSGKKIIG